MPFCELGKEKLGRCSGGLPILPWWDFSCYNQPIRPGAGGGSLEVCSGRGPCRDDLITWKRFPYYWPFVRGIHQSVVDSHHKGVLLGFYIFFVGSCNGLVCRMFSDKSDYLSQCWLMVCLGHGKFEIIGEALIQIEIIYSEILVTAIIRNCLSDCNCNESNASKLSDWSR